MTTSTRFETPTETKPADDERAEEASLRPRRLSEFVGQSEVREQLLLMIDSAKQRGMAVDHMLFSGPPGLGKTSLALIIAAEVDAPIKITSGPTITKASDLASILTSLTGGEVLFIDEIHRLSAAAEEMLCIAMEDHRLDLIIGTGPAAVSVPLDLPAFTVVGATTREGLLTGPLRDRFGFTGHMEFYEVAEIEQVMKRSAQLLGVEMDDEAATELAIRSKGTPRIANRLLRRVRDYAQVRAEGGITAEVALAAFKIYGVDILGLDRLDRAVLTALVRQFGGGPVGVKTLAMAVNEDERTVEDVSEPYLVRTGLIVRTGRGRVATALAWSHVGARP